MPPSHDVSTHCVIYRLKCDLILCTGNVGRSHGELGHHGGTSRDVCKTLSQYYTPSSI